MNGRERRSLLNLCLGVLGSHLEDIIDDLHCIAAFLPPPLKMTLLAMARRKDLVTDKVLEALLDESWEVLDISGAKVTDFGLERASEKCSSLKAIDISGCDNLTSSSLEALVRNCPLMQTLRCGGTSLSNAAAKQSMHFIVPRLDSEAEAEESWEILESKQVGRGALDLRWLVWPAIDQASQQLLVECPKVVVNPATSASRKLRNVLPLEAHPDVPLDIDQASQKQLLVECPRVMVNPATSASRKLRNVPLEAHPDVPLDSPAVIGIDPKTWSANVRRGKGLNSSSTITNVCQPWKGSNSSSLDKSLCQLSIAERFKLAFMERDERLASKRAKNSRQNQRRAEKAWLGSDTDAKAACWASIIDEEIKFEPSPRMCSPYY